MKPKKIPFCSKEVSWLSFNSRVLQEAQSKDVPLIERVRFLGIYSNNLDEFFRVRIATLKRLISLGPKYSRSLDIPNPSKTLKTATSILVREAKIFNSTYHQVLDELRSEHNVCVISDSEIPEELTGWVGDYFTHKVLPKLMPIIIKKNTQLYGLRDSAMYLVIKMTKKNTKARPGYAMLEIPTELKRFVVLPELNGKKLVMFLDDVIRFGLPEIFASLPYNNFEAYAAKFNRDAEMDFDDDITESYFEKVSEGLRARESGLPVRINYDQDIAPDALKVILKKLKITSEDSLYPGAHYHNRKDLMSFPDFGIKELSYKAFTPTFHPAFSGKNKKMFNAIKRGDILLHCPYHPFNHFLNLLREASIDPLVNSIKITQYRIAEHSAVAKALMNGVRNGKEVIVVVEPRARFDEKANISWANEYQNTGVKVVLGIPGLKIHAKLCQITRRESGEEKFYSCLGTGNFNESTSKCYTDHLLLTYDQGIGEDVNRFFRYFLNSFKPPKLRHLIASPFTLKTKIRSFIQKEIKNAKADKPAEICLKLNNLSDSDIVSDLYRAAKNNVKVRIIARSMFSLVIDPSLPNIHNIQAIGIVDRFLEHTRFYIFHNGGKTRYFLASADFLPRNFDSRCETVCPIYDKKLQKQLKKYFDLQWQDNVKARVLNEKLDNTQIGIVSGDEKKSAQNEIAKYIKSLSQ